MARRKTDGHAAPAGSNGSPVSPGLGQGKRDGAQVSEPAPEMAPDVTASPTNTGAFIVALLGVVAAWLGVVLWNAWLCDDAYITLRTVDNFVHGYGLRWNIAERVQSYSNPLWMFLLAAVYSITREDYFTMLSLSVVCSLAALLLLLLCVHGRRIGIVIGIGMLALASKAAVDYATSGLENPLSNLLLIAFWFVVLRRSERSRSLLLASFLASLTITNRMDNLLLCAPGLIWLMRRWMTSGDGGRRSLLGAVARVSLGMLPFLAWEVFAVIYYGFPFPNTAYVKLSPGWEQGELLAQGFRYLGQSFSVDRVTLPVVAIAIGTAVMSAVRGRRLSVQAMNDGDRRDAPPSIPWGACVALAAGLLLHVAYVVKIGGGFMSGRFLVAPFVVSLAWLAFMPPVRERAFAVSCVLIAVVGLLHTRGPLRQQRSEPVMISPGQVVADERLFYHRWSGLFNGSPTGELPAAPWRKLGEDARRTAEARGKPLFTLQANVGFVGYFAGPNVHVVDQLALADAFVARMPPRKAKQRLGHVERVIPRPYLMSLSSGKNLMPNETTRDYLDRVWKVTRGDLFASDRWAAIWDLNFGGWREKLSKETGHDPFRPPPAPAPR